MIDLRETRILPAIGRRVFSAPYLPRGLVGFTLLVIITNTILFLIGQPPEYWIDYSLAYVDTPWVKQMLAIHPLLYVGVTTIYLIVIGLFLDGLSRTPALILWSSVNFIHINDALSWARHALNLQLPLTYPTEYILYTFLSIAFAGLLGWSAARGLLSTKETARPSQLKPKTLPKVAVGVAAIWLLLLAAGLLAVMNTPASGWLAITPDHSPGPRVGGEIVFDSHRGKAVLFGGSNAQWQYVTETWEWDGSDWQQLSPQETPSERGDIAMAYDQKQQVVILFGGENQGSVLGDTWQWDGEQWHQLLPSNSPLARRGHKMIYDPLRGRVVLYGGYDGMGTFFNDAWEWDGQQWTQISFETTSPVASGFVMAYDQASSRIVAFLSGYPGGTWVWQGERWAESLSGGEAPGQRGSAKAIYDSTNERLVMFGGVQDGEFCNDTWSLKGLRWQKIDTPLTPTARWGHMMFYDSSQEQVIIFGGYDDENVLEDMWELSLPDGD